jgi:hypothetical protein
MHNVAHASQVLIVHAKHGKNKTISPSYGELQHNAI